MAATTAFRGLEPAREASVTDIDSSYAWVRLFIGLALGTIGGIGMWSVVVVLPAVQADFGITRADASFAYTMTMIGFGAGGILMGRLVDRFGLFQPLLGSVVVLCIGYLASATSANIVQLAIAHGLLISMLGSAITFGPLMADTSLWFSKRRGIAVAIAASGNYLAGTIWPPIVQYCVAKYGWRITHVGIGLFCLAAMLPLVMLMRRPSPMIAAPTAAQAALAAQRKIYTSPNVLQWTLAFAGVACCVAMSMPQVHIVAYCGDLGYGAARGAEMLSLMLGFGIVSRLASGFIADKIGGLKTMLLSSFLQMVALILYIPFDGLMSLYVISAMFGLFQGGIIPGYAIIVRENYPPQEAGMRVGIVLTSTMIGMAFGGWFSGAIFDWTGSYHAAFINGVAWNVINLLIGVYLIYRMGRPRTPPTVTA